MKNKLILALGILMLFAIALPAMAAVVFTDDFESPAFVLGPLAGQNNWNKHWGAYSVDMNVTTANPIKGSSSIVGTGVGDYEAYVFKQFTPVVDKTTISFLAKFDATGGATICFTDVFIEPPLFTIILYKDFWLVHSAATGNISDWVPLTVGHVYKGTINLDYTNHSADIIITDTTASTLIGSIHLTLPAVSINGREVKEGVMQGLSLKASHGTCVFDDVNVYDTPDSDDFESPVYDLGPLGGQTDWRAHWAGTSLDMDVSDVDPIDGSRSLVGISDSVFQAYVFKQFTPVVDKTTISFLTKFDATGASVISFTDMFIDPICTIVLYNEYWFAHSAATGYLVSESPLVVGNVYKCTINLDFTNHSADINVTDMTTSTDKGTFHVILPAVSINGAEVKAGVMQGLSLKVEHGNCSFDNVKIYETPGVLTGSLTGKVNLENFGPGDITSVPVTVDLGNGITPITLNLDGSGNFTIPNVPDGTYDVRIKASHWLARLTLGVIVAGDTIIADPIVLINGDVVDNNEVDFSDINAVRSAYGSFPGDETWNAMADVDGSMEVDFTDINIVRSMYGEIGD